MRWCECVQATRERDCLALRHASYGIRLQLLRRALTLYSTDDSGGAVCTSDSIAEVGSWVADELPADVGGVELESVLLLVLLSELGVRVVSADEPG